MSDDALLLVGTTQQVTPPQVLRAGPLSAELEAGNLRYIRYAGFEMIRAISFLVRGRVWNTFSPEIAELTVREDGDAFRVRYTATICDGDATLSYRARIDGTANGTLSFTAEGATDQDFVTCRAGFIVLHPIVGVAGEPVEIEHVDGRVVESKFPALIDPMQPMRDLRALTQTFAPGARVTCRMEGDTFEMEDQRNWTDASYKTYVRPLALPWPYTLAAGEKVSQAVTLRLHGRPAQPGRADHVVRIEIGEAIGTMPMLGLGCTPAEAAAALPHAEQLRKAGVPVLVCRYDPRDGGDLAHVRELAAALGTDVELQLVVPSVEKFAADIDAAAEAVRRAGLTIAAIAVSPAADLKSTPPGSAWPPCPPADAVLRATREAFPGTRLGGGMLSTFTELNRKRPPLDLIDYVTFCTTPNVHAGDDRSVMETLEALPFVAASVRAIVGDKPWVVGPSTIGMRDNPYGAAPLANPDNVRMAMAGHDPRQAGLFNAAWTLGHICRFAAGGASRIAVSAPIGDFGILAPDGTPYPVFHVIAGCTRLRGATLYAASSSRPRDVLALATATDLLIANLTPAPITVTTPATMRNPHVLDTASAAPRPVDAGATLTLAPYAVAHLRAEALTPETARMDPLARRKLGRTGVEVTQLGFGGAGLGDLFSVVPDEDAGATLAAAWDAGIRYYDTAPWYGRGQSEHRFGRALYRHPRKDFVLSTKVGRTLHPVHEVEKFKGGMWAGGLPFQHKFDYSYDGVMRAFEDSLQRLGLPRIDLLLIHDLDFWHHSRIERVTAYLSELHNGGWRALQNLKEQGLIRGIGAGINELGMMPRLLDLMDLDFFLVALRYTLLEQHVLDAEFPRGVENGVGYIIGGVFASGILATGAVQGAKHDYSDAATEAMDKVRKIEAVCERHKVPLPAAALQFPLGHPSVAAVIPGAINPDQVRRNVAAFRHQIPAELWAELKHEGLLRHDAPTP